MKNSQPTLFHNYNKRTPPVKPAAKKAPKTGSSSLKAEPTSRGASPNVSAADSAGSPSTTDLPYQEFKLMSCDRHGWKYDVMKFDSRRTVDIATWTKPIRLNRKELRRETASGGDADAVSNVPRAVGPMLGLDGKPVIGADGRMVMVDAEGRPIHNNTTNAPASSSGASTPSGVKTDKNDKLTPGGKKEKSKKFQKKTRQVYLVPDHIRQLRREERYPWLMEDSAVPQREVWVGRMEEASKSETHALFMPASGNVFRFVPAHRWYKFQKRSQRAAISLEEAEKLMVELQKQKDPELWLMRKRAGQVSAATLATIRGQSVGSSNSLVHSAAPSLGPGGRRLQTVDAGSRGLFEEDDEEGVDGEIKRRRERERGQDGDMDEVEYEDDFADDDEKPENEVDDEETKEIEERLKREYRNANKTREGYIDESEEEDESEAHLTGAGKAMKKLVRKVDKNAAYDSDDEKNPYASSDEEQEEETQPEITQTQALQQQKEQIQKLRLQAAQATQSGTSTPSRAGSQPPPPSAASLNRPGGKTPSRPPSNVPSRTNSPGPAPGPSPGVPAPPVTGGMGGHSVVAMRATSPKAPKLKAKKAGLGVLGGGRATSPLVGGAGSRAASPVPVPVPAPAPPSAGGGAAATAAMGTGTQKASAGKRKAEDSAPGASTTSQPKPKKRKPTHAASATSASLGPSIDPTTELNSALLVEWLRRMPQVTTRDCIQHFQPCLTNDEKKAQFTLMVKEVATLKSGMLVLKPELKAELEGAA